MRKTQRAWQSIIMIPKRSSSKPLGSLHTLPLSVQFLAHPLFSSRCHSSRAQWISLYLTCQRLINSWTTIKAAHSSIRLRPKTQTKVISLLLWKAHTAQSTLATIAVSWVSQVQLSICRSRSKLNLKTSPKSWPWMIHCPVMRVVIFSSVRIYLQGMTIAS